MIKNESYPITMDMYVLKMKIMYELGFYDSALSIADSYRHFISGSKLISEFLKNSNENFLKYFKSVLRLKINPNKAKLTKLLSELQKSQRTREKKWMIEKAGEFLPK